MKSFLAVSAIAAIMLLTACSSSTAGQESSPVPAAEQTTSQAAPQTTASEQTDAPETTASTVSVSAEQKTEIQSLLNSYKEFCYNYIECKEVIKHINANDIKVAEVDYGDAGNISVRWYAVSEGEITTMSALCEKMDAMLTENGIKDIELNKLYLEDADKLYLSENAGLNGGVLGVDTVYIRSVEMPDESTYRLNMTAFGDKTIWEAPNDFTQDFSIELKITPDGLRVDKCDFAAQSYIGWLYNSADDKI